MVIVNMGPIFYPAMADQGHSQSATTESVSESKYFIDTSYSHGIEHQSIHHTYEGVTYIERIWHLYTSCYPIINIAQWEGLWNHKTCKVLKRQHLHHHPAGTCRHNHTINAVAGIALMQRRRHRSAKCPPDRKPYTTKYSMALICTSLMAITQTILLQYFFHYECFTAKFGHCFAYISPTV